MFECLLMLRSILASVRKASFERHVLIRRTRLLNEQGLEALSGVQSSRVLFMWRPRVSN